MADLIPFPKRKVQLNEEEYEKFNTFLEKMKKARTKAQKKTKKLVFFTWLYSVSLFSFIKKNKGSQPNMII